MWAGDGFGLLSTGVGGRRSLSIPVILVYLFCDNRVKFNFSKRSTRQTGRRGVCRDCADCWDHLRSQGFALMSAYTLEMRQISPMPCLGQNRSKAAYMVRKYIHFIDARWLPKLGTPRAYLMRTCTCMPFVTLGVRLVGVDNTIYMLFWAVRLPILGRSGSILAFENAANHKTITLGE